MKQPQVIFLDAVGTLFGLRQSVGGIYGEFAHKYGVEVEKDLLQREFSQAFTEAPPLAFPGTISPAISHKEFDWWLNLVQKVFQSAGVFDRFTDFRSFFDELYLYFASDEPWLVYPEVKTTLQSWKERGIELGIISNFDSRLYCVLPGLGLDRYFNSITISSQAGVAKPHPEIYLQALKKHNCLPHEALHIGDSRKDDFQGAIDAGLHGILIERDSK